MNKKTFMTKEIIDTCNISGLMLVRNIETEKAKWIRRWRLCRVFNLDPTKPIGQEK